MYGTILQIKLCTDLSLTAWYFQDPTGQRVKIEFRDPPNQELNKKFVLKERCA